MLEVLGLIRNNYIEEESSYNIENNELVINMDSYFLTIKIKDIASAQYNKDDLLDVINAITSTEVESICIKCGTYIYFEEGQEHVEPDIPYSYIGSKIVSVAESKYKGCVKQYNIESYIVGDTCSMCDDVCEFGFVLFIDEKFWNNAGLFELLDKLLKKSIRFQIPVYYKSNSNSLFVDNYGFKVLPSNTKTRRLGYVKLLLQMLVEQKGTPSSLIARRVEKYVQPFNQFLIDHKNTKGVVLETKTGNSSKPYIDLAESMGMIRKTANSYDLGKTGNVYWHLKQEIDGKENNPFVLSDFDIAFFIEQLLKNDFMYMYVLLELICQLGNASYHSLKQVFQKRLLHRIHVVIEGAKEIDAQKALNLKMIERRIMSWEKPMTYLEHILMPRINWLFDLGLIEYKSKDCFSLTPQGDTLFFNLSIWNDLKMGVISNPIEFINSYYIRIVDDARIPMGKPYSSKNSYIVKQCIDRCFVLFSTLAPNRTTFSLAANYCKYLLLWKHSIILDINDLKSLLEREFCIYYIYKYQSQYQDGYIQKRIVL